MVPWKTWHFYFVEFDTWMKQRTIRAKDYFMWASAFDSLYQAIPVAHAAGVGVDIGETTELVNEMHVGHPVVSETAQVWDDEIQIWILWSQHFYSDQPAHYI